MHAVWQMRGGVVCWPRDRTPHERRTARPRVLGEVEVARHAELEAGVEVDEDREDDDELEHPPRRVRRDQVLVPPLHVPEGGERRGHTTMKRSGEEADHLSGSRPSAEAAGARMRACTHACPQGKRYVPRELLQTEQPQQPEAAQLVAPRDVVEREGREQVDPEPPLEVVRGDHLRVQVGCRQDGVE